MAQPQQTRARELGPADSYEELDKQLLYEIYRRTLLLTWNKLNLASHPHEINKLKQEIRELKEFRNTTREINNSIDYEK